MGNITLSLPEDILNRMKKFKEIKWDEVDQQKIIEYLESLELLEKISDLPEKEAIELGLDIHHQEINDVWVRWKKENIEIQ